MPGAKQAELPDEVLQHPVSRELLADPERAWEPFDSRAHWDRRLAAHALRRAGFGGTWAELQEAVRIGPQKLVDRLWTDFGSGTLDEVRFQRMERTFLSVGSVESMRGVWVLRMLHGRQPLVERMVLFWHDHFATSLAKVQRLDYMHRQIDLFRRYERGEVVCEGGKRHSFETLLRAVSRDPAMLVWLDGNSNRRAAPNENYARELMELFTLGIGNYTEKDIKEAARAFTGWFVRRDQFFFAPYEHDDGVKTVLGETGNWNGDDVIRILLNQPAASRFLPSKLYRYFISDIDPIPESLIEPLADGFRTSGFDTRWLVDRIVRSRVFFSPIAYRRKVSSPIDFVVGTVRRLEPVRTYPNYLAQVISRLGLSLYEPPSVAGWDEGLAWISTQTLLQRARFVRELTRAQGGMFDGAVRPYALCRRYGMSAKNAAFQFYVNLFLDGRLSEEVLAKLRAAYEEAASSGTERMDRALRGLIVALCTQPEYQLV